MKKTRPLGHFLPCIFVALLGAGLWGFSSYRFSACLVFCLSGVLLCFSVLRLMKRRFPKTAKVCKIMLILLVCTALVAAAVTGIFIGKASAGHAKTACDYLIVLGAGVNGTTPSLSLRDRLIAAENYLNAHPDTVCVVSGGQGLGEQISEAACMADWLIQRGMDPSRILLEDKASSTRENLAFSLDLIEESFGSRPTQVAVVSSEYHLFRAGLFAKEQGVTALGVPAKTHRVSLMVNYFLREIAAVWFYYIFGG